MVLQLFWVAATVHVVLAIAFALEVRRPSAHAGSPLHVRLAQGQRQDDWLACACIWAGLLHDELPLSDGVLVLGGAVLAWLARRTARRVLQCPR